MGRFVGAVLAGLGALCLAVAIGLPLYVAPAVTKLPNTLRACEKGKDIPDCLKPSVVEAQGAQFLQIKKISATEVEIKVNTATLRATTEVIPQAKTTAAQQKAGKIGDNTVIWDVFQTARRTDTSEVISASSTELALDRVSGAAVNWSGQWINEDGTNSAIQYSEQVYKFPFNTEKRDYKIYDTDVRAASTAAFKGVETVGGVETYHFVQQVPETPVSVSAGDLSVLIRTFAPTATSGTVVYSNTREVWVDPVTGSYIKNREQPHKEFRPNVGAPTVLLNADFVSTPDTIANSATSAKDNALLLSIVKIYGPIGAGVLGLVLLVVGLRLGRPRSATPAHAAPTPADDTTSFGETLPEGREQLREDGTSSLLTDTIPGTTSRSTT
jgi:hypothetical protein